MSKYYISTVLWATDIKEFADDRTAWEELRKLLPHKFATLFKEKEVEVPVNNEESYVEAYNSKYGPRPYGYGPDDAKLMKVGEKNIHTTFVPILEGITDDEYNVIKLPEVDLEKEIEEYFPESAFSTGWNYDDMEEVARHFFNLGLNARK